VRLIKLLPHWLRKRLYRRWRNRRAEELYHQKATAEEVESFKQEKLRKLQQYGLTY